MLGLNLIHVSKRGHRKQWSKPNKPNQNKTKPCGNIMEDIVDSYCQVSNTLQWRHNDHDSVSNHQPHGCLLHRLFRRRSKKTSKLRVTGLCVGISPGPVNSPHKGPVTRKMFPFDDVIMISRIWVGNEIVDHSDVVGASPVGAAPTTSSITTERLASMYCAKATASQVEEHLSFGNWCVLYLRLYGTSFGMVSVTLTYMTDHTDRYCT